MRVLFSWLKEFVEISLHPESLAHQLTMAGMEVISLSPAGPDWVFELEVTPNRPDLLSHVGIAREVAVILGRRFRLGRWLKKEAALPSRPAPAIPVTIEDSQGCWRYVGILIEGVQVKESPPDLAQRLLRLGLRPVNNVVDVTNLCLMELGQPLHAFDLDRLEGPAIRVRVSGPKETLVTLDGENRALASGSLVIADAKRPIALAGVMGGRETEISPKTQRVFLESAWFNPARVQRAGRSLRLVTESSYRFERGVDPEMVLAAASRAARLIEELSGGKIQGGPIDVQGNRPAPRRIHLKTSRARDFLGMRVYPAQQRRYLERLGCRVAGTVRSYQVEPPSWRPDLRIPEDLYEELARLWGYDRCPATLPPRSRQPVGSDWKLMEDPWVARQRQIRQTLAGAGFQEIYTYSLLSPEDHRRAGVREEGTLALENPLSVEQAVLRKTLLGGVLQTAARNLNRKTTDALQLFELGAVFQSANPLSSGPPRESRALSLLLGGTPSPAWGLKPGPLGIFHLKGAVERLFQRLQIPLEIKTEPTGGPFTGEGLKFLAGGKEPVGQAGRVDPKILSAHEIPDGFGIVYAELDLKRLFWVSPRELRVQPLPKLPPVLRDLAMVVDRGVSHAAVHQALLEAGRPLLKEALLFDLYQGPQVPPGKKSLAFRLSYSAGDRTLTDEEIAASHQKVVEALNSAFQATLR